MVARKRSTRTPAYLCPFPSTCNRLARAETALDSFLDGMQSRLACSARRLRFIHTSHIETLRAGPHWSGTLSFHSWKVALTLRKPCWAYRSYCLGEGGINETAGRKNPPTCEFPQHPWRWQRPGQPLAWVAMRSPSPPLGSLASVARTSPLTPSTLA